MPIVLVVLLAACAMMAVEFYAPACPREKAPGWWPRALVLNAVQIGMVYAAGTAWDQWMLGLSLWEGEKVLGTVGGALAGYLVITFIYYWWHRWRHENRLLWRWVHQLHHSPRRIEILTSFYKHPLEILLNSILSSAILYMVMGLDAKSASLAIALTGLAELFYHWNVRTPYWLGFIFQRPESHRIHHREGWHRNNFSDLPLWDMLFGTFENPRDFPERCGFSENRELRWKDMLRGRDVHGPY